MRESGILMHISSLPGPWGIGSMGRAAYEFVDFLEQAGQKYWQILPLAPTGYGNSPYQSTSSWAGNPYFIDLDTLADQGLLTKGEVDSFSWGEDPLWVDFGKLYENRLRCLKLAWGRFRRQEAYESFLEENASWLGDYALFMALKERFGGAPWLQWPEAYRLRQESALAEALRQEREAVDFQCFLQYQFFAQWKALHAYAARKGIRIIGDVPIYVPLDSADVWTAPELFQLDGKRRPTKVAGCPPDAFTDAGQLWGNPLYNWEKMADTGYDWWIRRLAGAERLYDLIRIDHFRGFESYWAVPYGDTDARNGTWVKGPGMDFFRVIREALPELQCIAEDLGYMTKEVRQLQLDSGYPGMKVLEFAFDSRESDNCLPHEYPEKAVCYTGTHDNVTLKQWLEEADPADLAKAKAYLGLNGEEGWVWGMLRGGMGSLPGLFVAQMQDYLELGGEARMNRPGSLSDANWTWRAPAGFDSKALAARIRALTGLFGRLPESER